jgi:hypothetical protein
MRLEVEFANRLDSEVEAIRQAYRAAYGHYDDVLLPDELWAGDPEMLAFVKFLPVGTVWRFSGDVEVEWAKRGRATVRVAFVNYRRTVLTLPPPPVIEPPPVTEITQCLWHQNLIPQAIGTLVTDGIAALAMSDGSFVQAGLARGVPAVEDTLTWHVSKYAKDGTILWEKKLVGPYYTDNTYDSPTLSPNICEGPNGSVYFTAASGTLPNGDKFLRIYLFRIDANGLVAQQASTFWAAFFNKTDGATGVNEGGHLLYLPVENKVMVLGRKGVIYVYNATTLALEQFRQLSPNTQSTNIMAHYVPNRGRVLLSLNRYIVEISPDALTNHQGWALTHTPEISTQNNLQAIFIDSFGGLWSAYSDESNNVYLTRHSPSEVNYAPIATYKWFVSGAGTSHVYIDQLSTGEIVLVRHGAGMGQFRAYVLSPDGDTVLATTTFAIGGIAATFSFFKGKMIDPDDYLIVGVYGNNGCARFPVKAVPYDLHTMTTATGNLTVSVSTDYTQYPSPAHTSIPAVASYTTAPSAQTVQDTLAGTWSTAPMADLWSYETTKDCKTFEPPVL